MSTERPVQPKMSEILPSSKPLTIICHDDNIEVDNDLADRIMEINPEMTLAMAASFKLSTWEKAKKDEDFKMRLRVIFPDWDITTDPRRLDEMPVAYRHVVGLIVCTNMAINKGMSPWWKLPETYLHPKSQAALADLAIMYSNLLKDLNNDQAQA